MWKLLGDTFVYTFTLSIVIGLYVFIDGYFKEESEKEKREDGTTKIFSQYFIPFFVLFFFSGFCNYLVSKIHHSETFGFGISTFLIFIPIIIYKAKKANQIQRNRELRKKGF